jgi:pyruvate kinase
MPTEFKIISTLSPLKLTREYLQFCLENHQPFFRLNGSHLSDNELTKLIDKISDYVTHFSITLILDLQGKKLRIGKLATPINLSSGQIIEIKSSENSEKGEITIHSSSFFEIVETGDIILLQDAAIQMEIISVIDRTIRCRVRQGGKLRSRAGLNIKENKLLNVEYFDNLKSQINIAKKYEVDYLALSYTTNAKEISNLKDYCRSISYNPRLIAKIEHPQAFDHLDKILKIADEIWYCRGDLGNFISPRQLSDWQEEIVTRCRKLNKPIIIAGQIFQHLAEHLLPTRSEVIHFYHLIDRGINGIVLSDETAIGINPINSMKQIVSLLH